MHPRARALGRVLLVITVVLTLSAVAATAAYWGTWQARGRERDSVVSGIAIPSALASAGLTPPVAASPPAPPVPSASGISRARAAALTDPALGSRVLADVVDARTGAVLYQDQAATPGAPASTAKLLTAAAVLQVHPASYRFSTTARVLGTTLYLVGGGDPTLSGAAPGQAPAYPGSARLSDLAAQLSKAGLRPSAVVVDDSLFAGPAVSPYWLPQDVPSSYGAAITATMADGGRATPSDATRSASPDLDAGHELARLLGRPDLPVAAGVAPASSLVAARVASAPLATLVEQMLEQSDNVIAEVLARQVAVATHLPATFAGAAQAVRTVLASIGVDVGAGMKDGSGLAASDRISPASLVALLRLAGGFASGAGSATASAMPSTAVSALLAGLPVAGWSGTLQDRYVAGSQAAAAGDVRAKTGSIDGVTSLAGFVHDRSGRLLVFSFDADRTPLGGTSAAEAGLDGLASALAACGCP